MLLLLLSILWPQLRSGSCNNNGSSAIRGEIDSKCTSCNHRPKHFSRRVHVHQSLQVVKTKRNLQHASRRSSGASYILLTGGWAFFELGSRSRCGLPSSPRLLIPANVALFPPWFLTISRAHALLPLWVKTNFDPQRHKLRRVEI